MYAIVYVVLNIRGACGWFCCLQFICFSAPRPTENRNKIAFHNDMTKGFSCVSGTFMGCPFLPRIVFILFLFFFIDLIISVSDLFSTQRSLIGKPVGVFGANSAVERTQSHHHHYLMRFCLPHSSTILCFSATHWKPAPRTKHIFRGPRAFISTNNAHCHSSTKENYFLWAKIVIN